MAKISADRGSYTRKRQIDLDYPYQVELPAAYCAGKNRDAIRNFCRKRPAAPRRYYARRKGIEYLTWCFSKAAHAKAFQARFGGTCLAPGQRSGGCLSLHYDRQERKLS